jgi:hypothetical protein
MRKAVLCTWLIIICGGISVIFWRSEWVYGLPTPIPKNYKAIQPGEKIMLEKSFQPSGKPLFLHFFNPGCPCSRFNMKHFKSLVKEYGSKIDFAIVVLHADSSYSAREIREKFNLDIPVSFNPALAVSCGVYSTPQAVLINTDNTLYYRGNYNRSRYCTDKKTNYAQLALESLINQRRSPSFDAYALKAYGCQLPSCNKPLFANGR